MCVSAATLVLCSLLIGEIIQPKRRCYTHLIKYTPWQTRANQHLYL